MVAILGSDAITHSYKHHKRKEWLTKQIQNEVNELYDKGSTIGSFAIFPNNRIDKNHTINQARGVNSLIDDRFDLTLECIRLFYMGQESPLYEALLRYKNFFYLFENFDGYINFFFLNDLVDEQQKIKFYLPFDDFKTKPTFSEIDEYLTYKEWIKKSELIFIHTDMSQLKMYENYDKLKFLYVSVNDKKANNRYRFSENYCKLTKTNYLIYMEINGIKFKKYFKEYEWSNVFAMLKNNNKMPLICNDDFKGKLVVISGATSGIGYVVAKKFASKGANLICINRNREKSEALKLEIEREYKVECNYILADLSSLAEVHKVAQNLLELTTPIDVLIHNAGVFLTTRELTADGIEKVFMVQYLSSFIINYILKEKLKQQEKARIIMVNSEGHRFAPWGLRLDDLDWSKRSYGGFKSYGSAKLAQLLSMLCFEEYFANSGVTINAMHPGAVKTETGQENGKLYKMYKKHILDKNLKTSAISAESVYYLGVSKDVEKISGKFFNLTCLETPSPPALDMEVAKLLWEISIKTGKLI